MENDSREMSNLEESGWKPEFCHQLTASAGTKWEFSAPCSLPHLLHGRSVTMPKYDAVTGSQ